MATVTQVKEATICPNYVDGQWVKSTSGKKLMRANPADYTDVVGFAPLSSREEMRAAIAAAKRAFPGWRDTPAPVRGKHLTQAARVLEERKEELARLLCREEGKTVSEAMGEILRTINIVEFTAGALGERAG